MGSLHLIGCSHQDARISDLAELTERREEIKSNLVKLHAEGRILGAVLLATCNRFEVLLEVEDDADPTACVLGRETDVPTRHLRGRAVVEHLLAVTAGLDSFVAGEEQILGQVRRAFRAAEDLGLLSRSLHMLRNRLLAAARELRQTVGLGGRMPSVASLAAVRLARAGARIAVVGAGEMGRLVLEILRRRHVEDVLVVNRTVARAEALARHFDGRAMSLSEFLDDPPALDGIVFAVDSPRPLLGCGCIPSLKVAIDISQPSVVDPGLREQPGVEVIDLDGLAEAAERASTVFAEKLDAARALVTRKSEQIWSGLSPARAKLGGVVDLHVEGALSELDRAFRTQLRHLVHDDRELVREILVRIAKRTAHYHIRDLRQVTTR